MEMLNVIFSLVATPTHLLAVLVGVALGLIFGILPGLGSPQILALLIPLSYSFATNTAIILMLSAATGTVFAGSITSILIGVPGTPINIATILDGFPLAKQGKPGIAIGAAGMSSLLGGIIGLFFLIAIIPFAKVLITAMSYPEIFLMIAIGIVCISTIGEGSRAKNLVSGLLGLLLATFGFEPMGSTMRFTFGSTYLWGGIQIIPAVVGLFGIAEGINLIVAHRQTSLPPGGSSFSQIFQGALAPFRFFRTTLQSSLVGTVVGIIPGIGASLSQFMAYTMTLQTSRDKSRFGKGDIRGVIAPESTNNASQSGALIPLLIFGIPGDLVTAFLLGALMLHDVPVGLNIIAKPDLLISIISAEVLANIATVIFGFLLAGYLIRLTDVPSGITGTLVICISTFGAFIFQENVADVLLTIVLGICGYLMIKFNYSRLSLAIGLILGSIGEVNFKQTLLTGGLSSFVTRPLSIVLLCVMVAVIFFGIRLSNAYVPKHDAERPTSTRGSVAWNVGVLCFFVIIGVYGLRYRMSSAIWPLLLCIFGVIGLVYTITQELQLPFTKRPKTETRETMRLTAWLVLLAAGLCFAPPLWVTLGWMMLMLRYELRLKFLRTAAITFSTGVVVYVLFVMVLGSISLVNNWGISMF